MPTATKRGLAAAREAMDIPREKVAWTLGISMSTVFRIEEGKSNRANAICYMDLLTKTRDERIKLGLPVPDCSIEALCPDLAGKL